VSNRRKYIESHWLVFAVKGAVALVAGLFLSMAIRNDAEFLAKMVGFAMLGLGIIEILNTINRSRLEHNWGFSLAVGIVQLFVAVFMLFTLDVRLFGESTALTRISLLSFYMLSSSILTIIMGFTCFKNVTDRIMWIVQGMIGAILGFVALGGSGLSDNTHIRLFGIYLLVRGLVDFIFGIHSRDLLETVSESRAKKAKKA